MRSHCDIAMSKHMQTCHICDCASMVADTYACILHVNLIFVHIPTHSMKNSVQNRLLLLDQMNQNTLHLYLNFELSLHGPPLACIIQFFLGPFRGDVKIQLARPSVCRSQSPPADTEQLQHSYMELFNYNC